MVRYPRYPWYLDRRRKLSPMAIKKIRRLHELGKTQIEIARRVRVTAPAVSWVLKSERDKKNLNQRKYKKYREAYYKYSKERRKEVRKRKRKLQVWRVRKYYQYREKLLKEKGIVMATLKYVPYKKMAMDLIRAGLSDVQIIDKIRMDKNITIPDWRIKQWRTPPKKKGIVEREDGLTPAKVISYLQSVAIFFLDNNNFDEAKAVASVARILERKKLS